MATVKHFAGNEAEFERTTISSEIDERTLREIYLPPFDAAVRRAGVWAVTTAYNKVNGIFASEHRQLLTEVLRQQWGFDGLAMSDWFGSHSTARAGQRPGRQQRGSAESLTPQEIGMSVTDVLSIQLYTMRSMGDLDRILDAVAEAGYRHVETVGSHLDDAAATKAKLKARGLDTSSSHVGLAALRDRPEAVVEACRTLGCDQLFMPAVPPDQRDMAAVGWRELGRELGALAERLRAQGIELGYHNHHWEMTPKEGDKTALELIFEAAGESPLTWQADVAWLVRGGVEPKTWLERYSSRLTSAHVKDIAPSGENEDEDGWADVGAGVLDWPDLWQACRRAGARWMVVEHDKPRDPARCARASFAFLGGMRD